MSGAGAFTRSTHLQDIPTRYIVTASRIVIARKAALELSKMSNSELSEQTHAADPKNSDVRPARKLDDSEPQITGSHSDSGRDIALATVATVGVVAVGAVVFEATLLPGLVLGAAAVLAPQYAPKLGSALRPRLGGAEPGRPGLGQSSARKAGAQAPTLSQLGVWAELIFQGTKIVSYAHRTYNLLGRGRRFR